MDMGTTLTSWFDESPETYDRARPEYPPALWAELFARLPERPSIVEIGPGTGKATGALLARGARVVAIEPGPNLASFLQRKFPDAEIEVRNEGFEAAELPTGTFDAVVAATSFHWVEAGIRVPKSHRLLRPGGVLAVVGTEQVASEADRGYFAASQPIYDRYFDDDPAPAPRGRDLVPAVYQEVLASGHFERVELFRYDWDQRYETEQYIDLVRSYSNTAQMEPTKREAFLEELRGFIDGEFAGFVVRPLVMTLTLARK